MQSGFLPIFLFLLPLLTLLCRAHHPNDFYCDYLDHSIGDATTCIDSVPALQLSGLYECVLPFYVLPLSLSLPPPTFSYCSVEINVWMRPCTLYIHPSSQYGLVAYFKTLLSVLPPFLPTSPPEYTVSVNSTLDFVWRTCALKEHHHINHSFRTLLYQWEALIWDAYRPLILLVVAISGCPMSQVHSEIRHTKKNKVKNKLTQYTLPSLSLQFSFSPGPVEVPCPPTAPIGTI